jgi:hypothetical protein
MPKLLPLIRARKILKALSKYRTRKAGGFKKPLKEA